MKSWNGCRFGRRFGCRPVGGSSSRPTGGSVGGLLGRLISKSGGSDCHDGCWWCGACRSEFSDNTPGHVPIHTSRQGIVPLACTIVYAPNQVISKLSTFINDHGVYKIKKTKQKSDLETLHGSGSDQTPFAP